MEELLPEKPKFRSARIGRDFRKRYDEKHPNHNSLRPCFISPPGSHGSRTSRTSRTRTRTIKEIQPLLLKIILEKIRKIIMMK